MTGKIFINYRRGDDPGFSQALYGRLESRFSTTQLFMDVDSISPGSDFVHVLDEQVAKCDVFLAVIGPGWINATNKNGARRLENPNDFVRIEIEAALKRGILVIPVLVNDAEMPTEADLVESLKPLARRNAVRLTHERFRSDCDGLIKAINDALDKNHPIQTTPGARRGHPVNPATTTGPPIGRVSSLTGDNRWFIGLLLFCGLVIAASIIDAIWMYR